MGTPATPGVPGTATGAQGQTIVTQPATAVKAPNHFVEFFKKCGHAILDVFKWAPKVAEDAVEIIQAEDTLTPEFVAALKAVIADAGVLTVQAASAVAEKGVNPTQDTATIQALEQLVKDFTVFAPLVKQGIALLEGVIHTPTPESTAPTAEPPTSTAPVEPATETTEVAS